MTLRRRWAAAAVLVWIPTVVAWMFFAVLFRLLNYCAEKTTGVSLFWGFAGTVAGPERQII
jgi:hypothetical protein